jgi:D-methionine transport system ATP-binding protein
MSYLSIQHLSKAFDGHNVLNDVSFEVEKGDIFGILGLSGAGKSTLVRCINGLERPSSGQVVFQGRVISSPQIAPSIQDRRKIAMIFQSFNLLQQRTALANVHLAYELAAEKDPDKEKSKALLAKVGLGDKLNSYPSQLSGGQQQRVAIARSLALNPEILLCDEATSALDAETSFQILDLLKGLNKELGLTILIISHQMSVLEHICTKAAILDQSRLVEQGPLSDVFLNPKTEIARKLIYSDHVTTRLDEKNLIRLLFNGDIDQPLISNIVEDCNILVSIVYADTKVIDGKTYGQVVIKLPYYEEDIEKLEKYLTLKKVRYEEVSKNELK